MDILLTPVGSAGDNYPFIGLGSELGRRGHRVAVATSGHYADLVERCGLEYVETGSDAEYRAKTADPNLWHPRKGFGSVMSLVGEVNRRLFDIVERRMETANGSLAVVSHSLDFASRIWQERAGLPVIRAHLQPSIVRSAHEMPPVGTRDPSKLPLWAKRGLWWLLDRTFLDPPIAPVVDDLRGRVGLAPVRRVFREMIHSPLLTVGLFPEWFAPPPPDRPASFRQTGFPLFDAPGVQAASDEVEAFLADGEPPVVFTPGSAMRFGHQFFAAAAGACARLGRRGMLLTREREHLPASLPAGVRHFDFAPLSTVLPRCAALVHSGGIGTMAAGFAAGVPQVISPLSHDQPDNALRVRRLGAGDLIMPNRLTEDRLAEVLDRLLRSEDVRRRCVELSERTRATDAIAETCDLIEAAVVGHVRATAPA